MEPKVEAALASRKGSGAFATASILGLPEAARRYLAHAIAEAAPLAGHVRLSMRGEIRLKGWLPFEATELLAPPDGFLWRATMGRGLWRVSGYDLWYRGRGELRWKMFGLFPLVSARGADIDRSAEGRLLAETIWQPAAWLSPGRVWEQEREDVVTVDGVRLRIADDGRLLEVSLDRWGDPGGGNEFGLHRFGCVVDEERTFPNGYTVPTRVRVGWHIGTDRFQGEGEFFRATIQAAEFG